MSDLISRQAAIAEFNCCELTPDGGIDANDAIDILERLPSAQPDERMLHESCTDCSLYDKDRHSCPRFNKVIPVTLRELQSAQPEQRWIPKEVEMKIPVKLDKGAYMPEKAHETDAGYDIRTPHSFLLRRSDMVMVHTGIHVNIPVGFYGELASKSGLCRDSEITTEAGIIDSGYTGEICVILKSGMKQRYFEAGDKITQLIIHELPYTELEAVDILPHTDRGADGFGSTGK